MRNTGVDVSIVKWTRLAGIVVVAIAWILANVAGAQEPEIVRVFILAGQSNMEGKAANALLEFQATDPKTQDLFRHLRRDGEWIVRDDVFIRFLERHGKLTIGYGSPDKTGLELEFGHAMGDHFDEPVLLIKTAWGGHSLYQQFRPPSAGMPTDADLQAELERAQQNVKKSNEENNKNEPLPTMEQIRQPYGSSYRNMLKEVDETLANCGNLFPELAGRRPMITGFVWFQGFNDMFGNAAPDEYESNLKHLITDLRRDLKTPDLPFVIGALGQNGSQPADANMQKVADAQLAMNEIAEFKGNVRAIRTDLLVDKEAERLFPEWQKHLDEWNKVGSDRPYHYLGSAIWFNRIGRAMADSMLELLDR